MRREKERGFTLIEIMVVLVILGLIGTVVAFSVLGQADKAKVDISRTKLNQVKQGVELFKLNENRYPKEEEGLDILTQPSEKNAGKPYLDVEQLYDAWDNKFIYARPGPRGKSYDVRSLGGDQEEGGEGSDADLSCWDSSKREE